MVLFAIVHMTIFLEPVGCTYWTRLSDDHSCRLTSLVSIPDADLEPTIAWSVWAEHYLYNTLPLRLGYPQNAKDLLTRIASLRPNPNGVGIIWSGLELKDAPGISGRPND